MTGTDAVARDLDFSRYSTTGVVGTARYASKELGERLWDASVDAVADTISQLMDDPSGIGVPGRCFVTGSTN